MKCLPCFPDICLRTVSSILFSRRDALIHCVTGLRGIQRIARHSKTYTLIRFVSTVYHPDGRPKRMPHGGLLDGTSNDRSGHALAIPPNRQHVHSAHYNANSVGPALMNGAAHPLSSFSDDSDDDANNAITAIRPVIPKMPPLTRTDFHFVQVSRDRLQLRLSLAQ
ncbi:Hypothetical protein Bxe_C0611 [Paraburkholderia xenovorans LB400]|uniref:Uncharacterized protein n=1 Tax=Paraburkholderia xenovorans (strain LB400) TaxID=266265 RepID=Q13HD0_PARXL|nr:Hypothetical protein Bxe_C0611 [Paraburkholderia xenovorans LB400]